MRRAGLVLALALLTTAPLRADDDLRTVTEYSVKPGETLGGIANRTQVPRLLIIEANGLQPPYQVRAGQKLVIPRRRTHTVKPGETGLAIALDYGVPWSAIAAANGIDSKRPVQPGQKLAIPVLARTSPAKSPGPAAAVAAKPAAASAPAVPAAALPRTASVARTPTAARPPAGAIPTPAPDPGPAPGAPETSPVPPSRFAWPAVGEIRRPFAPRTASGGFHDGIDITAPQGTAARAAAAGTVIFAGQGPKEYGLTVIIHHGGRWTTTYGFLDRITVRDGDRVKAGERVGLVGMTGRAAEPQLHFEVRRNRIALDPVKLLPKPN